MVNEDLHWYHLAICHNMDINWFYDDYEDDPVFAKTIDNICYSCPVRNICFNEGVKNKESGVWGGVYLTAGKPDNAKNSHKSNEEKKNLGIK